MDFKNYHLEIKEMSENEAKELKKVYKGTPSAFVRIGREGYVFPKNQSLMEQITFYYNIEIRKTDIFVATFPRSGTTMTQELVWLIQNDLDYHTASSKPLFERYVSLRSYSDLSARRLEEFKQRKCKNIDRLLRITWPTAVTITTDTNDTRFMMSHIPFCMLPPHTLDTAKVVYVARNPLDVAVSNYHLHRLLRMYEFVGDFKTFWYYFSKGSTMWSPYFAHVKQAWEKRNHPNMLFMFYEDITKDLPAAIRRISDFLSKSYSEEQIKGLCEHMKFENFKKNDAVNLDSLKEFNIFVPFEQSFVRKGKTGSWRDYFDEAMMKHAVSWIEENLRETDLKFPGLDKLLKANHD